MDLPRVPAHKCRTCRRHRAFRMVDHPAGKVMLCRYCSTVHASSAGAAWRLTTGRRHR